MKSPSKHSRQAPRERCHYLPGVHTYNPPSRNRHLSGVHRQDHLGVRNRNISGVRTGNLSGARNRNAPEVNYQNVPEVNYQNVPRVQNQNVSDIYNQNVSEVRIHNDPGIHNQSLPGVHDQNVPGDNWDSPGRFWDLLGAHNQSIRPTHNNVPSVYKRSSSQDKNNNVFKEPDRNLTGERQRPINHDQSRRNPRKQQKRTTSPGSSDIEDTDGLDSESPSRYSSSRTKR
ncbi:unnamed protein product [Strongylus vulgaris]|uniref:Uncharacterized protein n=1 Tax=Strongylus vulgaris TaxID=40348 RepID=A0A3P7KSX7_STRVU|nr:unnamed protein product [Strongylus vulgaris]